MSPTNQPHSPLAPSLWFARLSQAIGLLFLVLLLWAMLLNWLYGFTTVAADDPPLTPEQRLADHISFAELKEIASCDYDSTTLVHCSLAPHDKQYQFSGWVELAGDRAKNLPERYLWKTYSGKEHLPYEIYRIIAGRPVSYTVIESKLPDGFRKEALVVDQERGWTRVEFYIREFVREKPKSRGIFTGLFQR